jgi:putative endonuclease
MPREYFVYILASETRELYIGVTSDIRRRMHEHRLGLHPDSWAHEHRTFRLVCLEFCGDVRDAIRREKQLKRWSRRRKLALIESRNPGWLI